MKKSMFCPYRKKQQKITTFFVKKHFHIKGTMRYKTKTLLGILSVSNKQTNKMNGTEYNVNAQNTFCYDECSFPKTELNFNPFINEKKMTELNNPVSNQKNSDTNKLVDNEKCSNTNTPKPKNTKNTNKTKNTENTGKTKNTENTENIKSITTNPINLSSSSLLNSDYIHLLKDQLEHPVGYFENDKKKQTCAGDGCSKHIYCMNNYPFCSTTCKKNTKIACSICKKYFQRRTLERENKIICAICDRKPKSKS